MVTQAPKRSSVAIAIAFALSCVGLIIFVWTQFGGTIPFAPAGYRVHALFPETGLLVSGADVRISGVNVGRVVSVEAKGLDSEVVLDISQQYAPIPKDTRAILREKTLLGEGYIDLSTGDGNGPKIPDGGAIPTSQVAPTQQLDEVLNAFTPPVQKDLQEFLGGTGAALQGRGEDLNDALGNFDPTTTELAAVVGVLNQDQGDLKSLINNGASVLSTIGSRSAELQSLIDAGNSVFAATAGVNHSLTRTVDSLPAFLAHLRTTLNTLNTTIGVARPSLNDLAPVAPLLTPALRGLTRLAGPVLTLLHRAPAVLRQADVSLPDITKFFKQFKPAVNVLLPAAEQIAPIINIVADYKEYLVTGMANLAAIVQAQAPANTTSDADGVPAGQAKYLRALTTLGDDSVFGQSTRSPENRNNVYPAPGELDNLATGLLSASCANTSDHTALEAIDSNVPCKLQPSYPWGHGVAQSYYPHVTRATP